MFLFFDTETTGLPRNWRAPASDLASWPRLVQLAYLQTDDTGHVLRAGQCIIRPDGYAIPADASRIHGITTARAFAEGVPLVEALEHLIVAMQSARTVVAHNLAFDEKVVGAELLRARLPNPIHSRRRVCTMTGSTAYCAIPGPYGAKWPKLEELHRMLLRTGFSGAHSALADVQACARCFFELRRRGVVQ
jgi:DNA polymerase III epsilon subunit-like protein